MIFLKFLRYEKSFIYVYLISFLISTAIFLTGNNGEWEWGTFFYALALSLILLFGYLLFRFQQNLQVIRSINKEGYESLSLEGEYAEQYIEEMRRQHIHELNQIQDKQKEHYDFIVSWFHEIKTPIAVLRLLQQTDFDANSLREEITKIENYVDQALYYAKLDSFNQDYDIQNCDIMQIVKDTIRDHSKTFISKKIRININSEQMEVQSDPKWLKFIVNQLVTNSLKYTEPGGEIKISFSETPQEKLLLIQDNGIGIPEKDLPRIFNRGFTGETGRKFTKSTGMGLYLAQQLSNKLGHYISCSSEVNEFTRFIVHFPKDYDPYLLLKRIEKTTQ